MKNGKKGKGFNKNMALRSTITKNGMIYINH